MTGNFRSLSSVVCSLSSVVCLLSSAVACQPAVSTPEPATPMGADIRVLAGPAFGGREAGSPGGDSAAEFISPRYQQLGLRPAFRVRCEPTSPCPESYFQSFKVVRGMAQNVAAIVDGTDPQLREEVVVIGAHFDHLGRSP